MIESSHKQENWFSMGPIVKPIDGTRFLIKDMMVRWNEQQRTIDGPDGVRTEYVYDTIRFDLELPLEVQPGIESVEYYLENAKSAILTIAHNLASQEEGFCGTN